jgi:hypothetical protein
MFKIENIFLVFFMIMFFLSCTPKKENNNIVFNESLLLENNDNIEENINTALMSNKSDIEPELPEYNGIYRIISAYSLIHDQNMKEISTEKIGELINIDNKNAVFENLNFTILDKDPVYGIFYYGGEGNTFDYYNFRLVFAGMNYLLFDENIIGKDYKGKVYVRLMKNEEKEYLVYFANNIIIINAQNEPEFASLAEWDLDQFFYITEKME